MNYVILSVVLLFSSLSLAYDFKLTSGEYQTQIIELYTSEGCSSCPPADRWLSSLKTSAGLFKDYIPLAFHVGYWDYIGWKDELASPTNASRQKRHKQAKNLSSVYTPGVLKSGKEWRRWRGTNIDVTNLKVGLLQVSLKSNHLKASFNPAIQNDFKLNIALVGMNIESRVLAGENSGKTLKHDFVVLKHQSFSSSNNDWSIELSPSFFHSKYKTTAFVAWVESTLNPSPIQAVGQIL